MLPGIGPSGEFEIEVNLLLISDFDSEFGLLSFFPFTIQSVFFGSRNFAVLIVP